MTEKIEESYLTEIQKIGRKIGGIVDLDNILSIILDSCINMTEADSGSLMLLDEKTKELSIKAAKGLSEEIIQKVKVKLGERIAGRVAQKGEGLLLIEDDGFEFEDVRKKGKIKSAISVPLKANGKVIGVLNLSKLSSDSPFTPHDKKIISIFTVLSTVAIENVGLYQEAEKGLGELSRIYELSCSLGTLINEEEILELIFTHLRKMIKFDMALLLLLQKDNRRVIVFSEGHAGEELIKKEKQALIDTFLGLTKTKARLEDVSIDKERFQGRFSKEVFSGPVKSQLNVPLMVKGEVIGVFSIKSLKEKVFTKSDLRLFSILANQTAIALENAWTYADTQKIYASTIEALATEIEVRNPYTRGHSERVSKYAVIVGKKLGMPQKELLLLHYAGTLHDLGKIGIEDAVVNKTTFLTDEEYTCMKEHPIKSTNVVKPIEFLHLIVPAIRHHHERFDGFGYPDGIKGEEIPFYARILAVVDSFDAMTSDRPYRAAKSFKEAVAEIRKCSGAQFDPAAVAAFLEVIKDLGEDNTKDFLAAVEKRIS